MKRSPKFDDLICGNKNEKIAETFTPTLSNTKRQQQSKLILLFLSSLSQFVDRAYRYNIVFPSNSVQTNIKTDFQLFPFRMGCVNYSFSVCASNAYDSSSTVLQHRRTTKTKIVFFFQKIFYQLKIVYDCCDENKQNWKLTSVDLIFFVRKSEKTGKIEIENQRFNGN